MAAGPGGAPPRAPRLILASASPRRRELLGRLVPAFEVMVSGEDEDSAEARPDALAAELARRKGQGVAAQHPDAVVLAADTVVALGTALLAKPRGAAENADFLRRLSGRTHEVHTGVAVFAPGGVQVEVERTAVTFRALTEAEIAHYAASGEGLDKAGGYGIQDLGMALVARVEGDYGNVVGLPLALTIRLLRAAGVPVWGGVDRA